MIKNDYKFFNPKTCITKYITKLSSSGSPSRTSKVTVKPVSSKAAKTAK